MSVKHNVTVSIPNHIEYESHSCTFGALLTKLETARAVPELSQRGRHDWNNSDVRTNLNGFLTGQSFRREIVLADLIKQEELYEESCENLTGGELELCHYHLGLIRELKRQKVQSIIEDGQHTAYVLLSRFGKTAHLPILCDPNFSVTVSWDDTGNNVSDINLDKKMFYKLEQVVKDAILALPCRYLEVKPKNRTEMAKDFKDINSSRPVPAIIPAISMNTSAFRNQNAKRGVYTPNDPSGDRLHELWSGDTLTNVQKLYHRLRKNGSTVYGDPHHGLVALFMNIQVRTFHKYAKKSNGRNTVDKGIGFTKSGLDVIRTILEDDSQSKDMTLGRVKDAEFNRIIGGYANALESLYPDQNDSGLDLPPFINAFGLVEILLNKDSITNEYGRSYKVRDWTELFCDFIDWNDKYYSLTNHKRYTDEDVRRSMAADEVGEFNPYFVNDKPVSVLAPEHIGRKEQIKDKFGKVVDVERSEGYWFCSKWYKKPQCVTERNNIIRDEFLKSRLTDYLNKGVIVDATKKTPIETYSIGDDLVPDIDINGGLNLDEIQTIDKV